MVRKIAWTDGASDDLKDTCDHIAKDSIAYSESFAAAVLVAVDSLSLLAERGTAVKHRDCQGIREIYVKSHRIMYRVEGERVDVLAVLHGARSLDFALTGRAWKD